MPYVPWSISHRASAWTGKTEIVFVTLQVLNMAHAAETFLLGEGHGLNIIGGGELQEGTKNVSCPPKLHPWLSNRKFCIDTAQQNLWVVTDFEKFKAANSQNVATPVTFTSDSPKVISNAEISTFVFLVCENLMELF